ncbi:MAG: Lon protease-like protein [Acidobacteriaceae bacterium]|nr:Lon protease-like protein [Acidobacteriaceae bacterium]
MSALLPLFPLDLVLFPGTSLPLHIFEPRYREMVSECLAEKKHFGVVRAKDDGIAEIGCTAEIVDRTKTYDDGRMDVLTAGRERFEVMQVNQERSFLQAEVIYLQDELNPSSPEEKSRAMKLHAELMTLAGAKPEGASEIAGDNLAYHLAGSLPLDLDFKQTLLEMKSESERVQAIISFFEAILPSMRRTVHVRQKAGGNGHAG